MKRPSIYSLVFLSACFSFTTFADTPSLSDANKLFDFAQSAEPTLFFPATATQQTSGAGSDWFYRYYSGSDSYAAININGVGQFSAGGVYVLGGQFGAEALYVDTLTNLLVAIGETEPLPSDRESAITNPGNGNCVARIFPIKNDTASIRTTTFSEGTSTVTDRTEFYEEVTDTQTITVIEQTTATGDSQTLTSNRHTSYFESVSGMFFNSENSSQITSSSTGLPSTNQSSTTIYEPSLFVGPSDSWCEGQEWFAAPVTQTMINSPDLAGNGPVISQTPPTAGIVNSIGELVTVEDVTYSTIKMTLSYPDSRMIIWTDIEFGVTVMSETYKGDSASPSSVEVLTQLALPF